MLMRSLGLLFLTPNPDDASGLALVLSGIGWDGLESAYRLFPVRTGVALPDWGRSAFLCRILVLMILTSCIDKEADDRRTRGSWVSSIYLDTKYLADHPSSDSGVLTGDTARKCLTCDLAVGQEHGGVLGRFEGESEEKVNMKGYTHRFPTPDGPR